MVSYAVSLWLKKRKLTPYDACPSDSVKRNRTVIISAKSGVRRPGYTAISDPTSSNRNPNLV